MTNPELIAEVMRAHIRICEMRTDELIREQLALPWWNVYRLWANRIRLDQVRINRNICADTLAGALRSQHDSRKDGKNDSSG